LEGGGLAGKTKRVKAQDSTFFRKETEGEREQILFSLWKVL
jgi:hypothetical protein